MMKRYNFLLIIFTLVLIIISIYKLYEFSPDFRDAMNGVDDWNRYAKQGLDIKNNGVLINSISTDYNGPGGFLYNYFIALILFICGDHIAPIYITQTILLGLSVAFTFWTFMDHMKKSTRYYFLGALFTFATLDVYSNYTLILLSENLGLFLFSAFIYCFLKSIRFDRMKLLLLATLLITMSALIRPNIALLLLLYLGILLLYKFQYFKNNIGSTIVHLMIISVGFSLIPLRNYFVTGNLTIFPLEGTSDSLSQLLNSGPYYFLQKIFFCFGYLSGLVPEYEIRVHWVIMWIGYFIFLFKALKNLKSIPPWKLSLNLFIISYILSLIVFSVIQSYGYRYLIPINFIILGSSFLGFEILIDRNGDDNISKRGRNDNTNNM